MSASSRIGASTSAISIAHPRKRREGCRSVAPTSSAAAITPVLGSGPLKAAIANTRGMMAYSLPFPRMSPVKSAAVAALTAVALSACASTAKPAAGHGKVDDPRSNKPNHLACLRGLGLPVSEFGRTGIQIGSLPSGPTIVFAPTPGAAQGKQIKASSAGRRGDRQRAAVPASGERSGAGSDRGLPGERRHGLTQPPCTCQQKPHRPTPPACSSHARSRGRPGCRSACSTGRLYLLLAGVAIVIAALSLLLPSTPSYDPWSWLVWGRQIVHLDLQTTGGPTWKPLTVLLTTLFAPFGQAQPDLLLLADRAGAVMAVLMTFRISCRILRPLTLERIGADAARLALVPVLLGATIAAASLINSPAFITDNGLGYSEGLMAALVLIALDRHLDGAHRQALVVGFLAALDRPELWLLWGPYGLYLWWRDPGTRRLFGGLVVLLFVLWFLPSQWGAGNLLAWIERAQHPRSNSAAFAKCPFCTESATTRGRASWTGSKSPDSSQWPLPPSACTARVLPGGATDRFQAVHGRGWCCSLSPPPAGCGGSASRSRRRSGFSATTATSSSGRR